MTSMRTLILTFCLAAATPAAAQPPYYELDNLRAQQEAASRRVVEQTNQLNALDARVRTDQALLDLQTGRYQQPAVPELRYAPAVMPAPGATPKYPSIPEAALADSNRRVQAASKPRP